MITHLPHANTELADTILGEHLHHLRECQERTRRDVASRLPARLRLNAESLAAAEAGRSTVLRSLALTQDGHLLARAYGAGQSAYNDWRQCAEQHQRLREAAEGFDPACFYDLGPGWTHRYQLLENRATGVLLAAGGQVLPIPLLTAAFEQALWDATPGVRPQRHRERAALGPLAGTGCALCQVYRSDALTDSPAVRAWQREVHRARTAAFATRIRSPGAPDTVLLLDEAVLHRRTGGKHLHAEQMRHLLHLIETTALQVRLVPMSSGTMVPAERVQLQLDAGALSVSLSDMEAVYRTGADPALADLQARSLTPEISVDLLRQAADGTLERLW